MHLIQRPSYQQGRLCQDPEGNRTSQRSPDTCKEIQAAVVWSCFPFIRSGQNHLARHSEKGKKTRRTKEKAGRQHQAMDRPRVRQVPEGGGEQGKMEKTGCKIICGAPTTLAVKGIDDDDDDDIHPPAPNPILTHTYQPIPNSKPHIHVSVPVCTKYNTKTYLPTYIKYSTNTYIYYHLYQIQHLRIATNLQQIKYQHAPILAGTNSKGLGGGSSLACEDLGRMFDHSFSACTFFFFLKWRLVRATDSIL